MRETNKLTALRVSRAKKPGRYCDGHGLWLQVGPTGAKSWVFRYMLGGRARHMGLGSCSTFNLKEARERARQARQLLADHQDPLLVKRGAIAAEKVAAAKMVTFRKCAEDFLAFSPVTKEWTNPEHRRQWASTLEQYAYPVLGDLPVSSVDVPLVLKALLPLWHRAPETASRVRGRIERVLGWAKANGLREGDNSASWRGNLKDVLGKLPKQKHHAALPYAELPAFTERLRERSGVSIKAIEFLILTAARAGEAFGARWSEFDLPGKVWVIPAERMKRRVEHRVPLSPAAIDLLESLPRDDSGAVFLGGSTGRQLDRSTALEALKRIEPAGTLHGLRSSFSDWAHERTAYPRDVIEMALAHAVKGKTEAAYWRGDAFQKRARLMDEWARFCSSPAVSGEVVALHG
jgi:integrase